MFFELTITSVAYGGSGVARKEGFVYFVPGVLPGELVLCEETSRKKSYGTARPAEILRTSQKRVASACPLSLQPLGKVFSGCHYCPGCAYQSVAYEEEVSFKQAQLVDFIERGCGVKADVILQAPVPSPLPLGYRNKITLHSDRAALGYFSEDNRTVVDVARCPLADNTINEKLAYLRRDTEFMKGLLAGTGLTLKHPSSDQVHTWTGSNPPTGREVIREATAAGELLVPLNGFFQVNPHVADLLVKKVMSLIRVAAPAHVFDLYCGSGLFSFAAAAAGVPSVAGADSDAGSIRAANSNAERLGAKGIRFMAGDAGRLLHSMMRGTCAKDSMLIVDPPRAGLGKEALQAVTSSEAGRLLYVSCSPDMLARDIKKLMQSGYALAEVSLFDMFPRTAHFETLAVLERGRY